MRDKARVFGPTIFLAAFLLFLVQPLLGKHLLPRFGGGTGVWTVCLLFFQLMLLAGYGYAHLLTTRFGLRRQLWVHGALLLVSLAWLPIVPKGGGEEIGEGAPTLRILWLLGSTVGLPYLLLGATGPLLQRWLALTVRGDAPYRLYALSNAGSLLALLAYPLAIEPLWPRVTQAWIWSAGMVLFVAGCGACVWRVRQMGSEEGQAPATGESPAKTGARMRWIAFPALASLLLVAVTNKLTTDVAPMPFLWVAPLAVYLTTFILTFDRPEWYRRGAWVTLLVASGGAVALTLHRADAVSWAVQVAVYLAALLAGGMVCHGEVYGLRPSAAESTRFYLCLAAGGAVGSGLATWVAPLLFVEPAELQVGFCALVSLLGLQFLREGGGRARRGMAVLVLLGAVGLAVIFFQQGRKAREGRIAAVRNFYGSLRVMDLDQHATHARHLELVHGSTSHGAQFLTPERRRWPTLYYGERSGVGLLLGDAAAAPRRIGVVGLGAGTLATYGRIGDEFVFYELNPAVVALARGPFTFLRDSRARIEVVAGDARQAMEAQARHGRRQGFDVLVLDAFSSDSIPVHLLTVEAMDGYLLHLKPGGVIAVHISNLHLDLRGVMKGLAEHFGMQMHLVHDVPPPSKGWLIPSEWVLMAKAEATRLTPDETTQRVIGDVKAVLWTDERASVWTLLR